MKRVQGAGFSVQGGRIDRRRFVDLCGCAAAGLALAGCASLVARPVTAVDGRITLRLADFPELARRNGSLVIQPQGMADPLYVLNNGDRPYAALSPICTHRGCTVEIAGPQLECPCHGSMYDREGRVIQGPAERALTSYPAVLQGDRLVIEIGRPS